MRSEPPDSAKFGERIALEQAPAVFVEQAAMRVAMALGEPALLPRSLPAC